MLILAGVSHARDFFPVGDNAEHNNKRYAGRVMAVAPVTQSTILIGTDGGGVWKTTNGGQNWEPKTDRERSLRITAIGLLGESYDETSTRTTIHDLSGYLMIPLAFGLLWALRAYWQRLYRPAEFFSAQSVKPGTG